ncbi:MAG: hypothetical protein CL932_10950 [Deltaproteobacteria bacterium]|nr:hypothetical protein [Deltaproteobacteria bacterium]MBK05285.1 hypothetical protein [Deltaproteobacteria bacterium]
MRTLPLRIIFLSICLMTCHVANLHAKSTKSQKQTKASGDVYVLPFQIRSPLSLSPDGQKVLHMKKIKGTSGYHYAVFHLRTKKDKVLCHSPGLSDDIFFFNFDHGVWAPDSESFIMLKKASTKKGGSFGPLVLKRCSLAGKESALPTGKGFFRGGVFTSDGSLYFIRNLGTRRTPNAALCHTPKGAKQPKTCLDIKGLPISISVSPDQKAIGGLLAGRDTARIWVYKRKEKSLSMSQAFLTDDYLWKPLAHWSLDSQSLFVNGNMHLRGKRFFSVYQFHPFTPKKRFDTFLKDKAYSTLGEKTPGTLLVFQRRGMKPRLFNLKMKKFLPDAKPNNPSDEVVGILGRVGTTRLGFTGKRKIVVYTQK